MAEPQTPAAPANVAAPAAVAEEPKIFVEKGDKAVAAVPASAKPEPDLATRKAELAKIAEGERRKLAARQQERMAMAQLEQRAMAAEQRLQLAEARANSIEEELRQDALGFVTKRGVSARDIGDRIVREGSTDEKLAAARSAAEEASRPLATAPSLASLGGEEAGAWLTPSLPSPIHRRSIFDPRSLP